MAKLDGLGTLSRLALTAAMLVLGPAALWGCYYNCTVDLDMDGTADCAYTSLDYWNPSYFELFQHPNLGSQSTPGIALTADSAVEVTFVSSYGYWTDSPTCGESSDETSLKLYFIDPELGDQLLFTNASGAGDSVDLGVIPANTVLQFKLEVHSTVWGDATYHWPDGAPGEDHAHIHDSWESSNEQGEPVQVWRVGFEASGGPETGGGDQLCWEDTWQDMFGTMVLIKRQFVYAYPGTDYQDLVVDVEVPICEEISTDFALGTDGWGFASADVGAARKASVHDPVSVFTQERPFDAMSQRVAQLLQWEWMEEEQQIAGDWYEVSLYSAHAACDPNSSIIQGIIAGDNIALAELLKLVPFPDTCLPGLHHTSTVIRHSRKGFDGQVESAPVVLNGKDYGEMVMLEYAGATDEDGVPLVDSNGNGFFGKTITKTIPSNYRHMLTRVVSPSAFDRLANMWRRLPQQASWEFPLGITFTGNIIPLLPGVTSYDVCGNGSQTDDPGCPRRPTNCNYFTYKLWKELDIGVYIDWRGAKWVSRDDPMQRLRDPLVGLAALDRLGVDYFSEFYWDNAAYGMTARAHERFVSGSGGTHGVAFRPGVEEIIPAMSHERLLDQVIARHSAKSQIDAKALYDAIEGQIEAGDTVPLHIIAGGYGGHAVLAYAIRDCGPIKHVYVYDPNKTYPAGTERDESVEIVFVQTGDGSMQISGGTKVQLMSGEQSVDRQTTLAVLKGAVEQVLEELRKNDTFLVHLKCPADLLFTDSQGRRVGHLRGEPYLNEIPGAEIASMGAIESYRLPAGETYQVTVTGLEQGSFQLEALAPVGGPYGQGWFQAMRLPTMFTTAESTATFTLKRNLISAVQNDLDGDGAIDETLPTERQPLPLGFFDQQPLFVAFEISPNRLNLKSQGQWVKASLVAPPGLDAGALFSHLNDTGIVLEGTVRSDRIIVEQPSGDSPGGIGAKIPRAGTIAAAQGYVDGGQVVMSDDGGGGKVGEVGFTLLGQLASGRPFIGTTRLQIHHAAEAPPAGSSKKK